MRIKEFFSPKLYFQGFKKMRGAGIATAVIVTITNILFPLITLFEELSRIPDYDAVPYASSSAQSIEHVTYESLAPCSLLIIILAPIIILSAFSFLNDRKKSDFYHALPQRRECVFLSFMAAALTWSVGTIIVSTLLNSLLWTLVPNRSLSVLTVLFAILATIILTLFVTALTSLAMTVTGTPVANVLITLLFALFFRIIGALLLATLDELCLVFVEDMSPLRCLSFSFYLPAALLASVFNSNGNPSGFTNIPLLIYTLVISLAILALACFTYRQRLSEMAGRSAPSKKLQHVYRCAITLPLVILPISRIATEGLEGYHLVLLVLALIVYMIFELITTKKPKNMLKTLPMFLVPVAISIVFMFSVVGVGAAIESVRPDDDDIAGVALGENHYYNGFEQLIVKDTFVADRDLAKIIARQLKYSTSSSATRRGNVSLTVRIKLENGREIARDLLMSSEDQKLVLSLIETSEEMGDLFIKLPSKDIINHIHVSGMSSFEKEDAYELWSVFCEEYATLSSEDKARVKGLRSASTDGYKEEMYMTSLAGINISGQYKLEYFSSYYHVYPQIMPRTASKYLELYNASQYESTPLADLREIKDKLLEINGVNSYEYRYCNVNVESINDPTKNSIFFNFSSSDEKNWDEDFAAYKNIISFLSQSAQDVKSGELDNVYRVSVTMDGIFPEEETAVDDVIWYQYVHKTYYFTISDEAIAQIAAIANPSDK